MFIMKTSVVLCLISNAGGNDLHLLLVGLYLFPRSYCHSKNKRSMGVDLELNVTALLCILFAQLANLFHYTLWPILPVLGIACADGCIH